MVQMVQMVQVGCQVPMEISESPTESSGNRGRTQELASDYQHLFKFIIIGDEASVANGDWKVASISKNQGFGTGLGGFSSTYFRILIL